MNSRKFIILLILLFAFFSRFYLSYKQTLFYGSDELKHVINAKFYWEYKRLSPWGELVYFNNGKSTLLPKEIKYSTVPYAHKIYNKVPFLYHILLSVVYGIADFFLHNFISIMFQLRLVNVILGTISVWIFYKISKLLKITSPYDYLLTFLYSSIPLSLMLDSTINWDGAVNFFSVLTAFFILKSVLVKSTINKLTAGILAGVSFLIKPTAVFLLIPVLIHMVIDKKNRKNLFFVLIVALVITLPYMLYSLNIYHELIPDPQKDLYIGSATFKEKSIGIIGLLLRHSSLIYPRNITHFSGVIENLRIGIIVFSIIIILTIFILGVISGIIDKKIKKNFGFFTLSTFIYLIFYIYANWQYVPFINKIPDRSARTFAPLFFTVPFILYMGINKISKSFPKYKNFFILLLLTSWCILIVQVIFF